MDKNIPAQRKKPINNELNEKQNKKNQQNKKGKKKQKNSHSTNDHNENSDWQRVPNKAIKVPDIKLKNLGVFRLKSMRICSIYEFCHREYEKLIKVDFSGNIVKFLPPINAPNLEQLYANNCEIEEMTHIASYKYQCVKVLSFEGNRLTKLPVIMCPKLRLLILEKNSIKDIEQFLEGDYPELIELNLKHNKLGRIGTFKNAPKLQILRLRRNQITNIDEIAKGHHPNLSILSILHNKLQSIPSLREFPNLKILNFHDNCIKQVDDFVKWQHPHLQQLDLSKNELTEVPIVKAKSLWLFNLNQNLVWSPFHHKMRKVVGTQSEKPFFNWKAIDNFSYSNLKALYLANNFLPTVQFFQFLDLRNLSELKLKSNLITLTKTLQKQYLPQLGKFDLTKNPLRSQEFSGITQKEKIRRNKEWLFIFKFNNIVYETKELTQKARDKIRFLPQKIYSQVYQYRSRARLQTDEDLQFQLFE